MGGDGWTTEITLRVECNRFDKRHPGSSEFVRGGIDCWLHGRVNYYDADAGIDCNGPDEFIRNDLCGLANINRQRRAGKSKVGGDFKVVRDCGCYEWTIVWIAWCDAVRGLGLAADCISDSIVKHCVYDRAGNC